MNTQTGEAMFNRTISVKEKVRQLLIAYPTTRGDDRVLVWRYLRAFTGIRITFSTFEALRQAPAFETIRRRRQEIQAQDDSLRPTLRTLIKRERRERAFRKYYGQREKTLWDFQELAVPAREGEGTPGGIANLSALPDFPPCPLVHAKAVP